MKKKMICKKLTSHQLKSQYKRYDGESEQEYSVRIRKIKEHLKQQHWDEKFLERRNFHL
jgi:hypothetical protein